MRIRINVLICLLFLTIEAYSQADFRSAYIVKLDQDTIHGLVDYRGELLMGKVCRFKLNEEDKVKVFSPDEILEYKFDGSKYYVSKEVNGQKTFLEFLVKGKINVYSLRDNIRDRFFIEKSGLGLTELPYEEGIKYKDNKPYEWQSTSHIGLLYVYMQDASDFQSRINNMHKPKAKWLVELAEDYHNKVCRDEKCIVFERKLPFIKVNLELTYGMNYSVRTQYYFYNYPQAYQKKIQVGVLANFWLPTVNEKLYLRTGIIFSSYESESQNKIYEKIPIQIEYIYPKGAINPKIAYGINLYRPFNYTVSLMPGINIRISKRMGLEANLDLDFVPTEFPLIPKNLFSYDFVAGFYIKL